MDADGKGRAVQIELDSRLLLQGPVHLTAAVVTVGEAAILKAEERLRLRFDFVMEAVDPEASP
jgi:hypothetical protein